MWSNNYIKVPFKERGRDRDGADCWGLVMLVYLEQLGVKLPSLLFYEDTFDFSTIRKLVSEQTASDDWEEVERGQEKPFDVVVSRMVGYETHVGIVVKRG